MAFKESERVFLDLYDFDNYKNHLGEHSLFFQQQLQYDLIKSIPKQIEKFFEMQRYEIDSAEFNDAKLQKALSVSLTKNGFANLESNQESLEDLSNMVKRSQSYINP